MKIPNLMSTLEFKDVVFEYGDGPYLIADVSHKKCIDFFTDVGTASLGYNSPQHQQALYRMWRKGMPVHSPNLYRCVEREKAALLLCNKTGMDKVFFCNSGTEAVEAAIKLARLVQTKRHEGVFNKYRTRYKVYSVHGSFHGRTLGALASGDGPKHHNYGFGPKPQGFEKFHLGEPVPSDAAAVIIAPVFGNNDVRVYDDLLLRQLRSHCDDHRIILIFDEVQTGSGRCGLEYTYGQRIGVMPDIVTLAKGLGMGFPVGACLARGDVAEGFTPGSHFSTFGGNPISCVFVNVMLGWANPKRLVKIEQLGNCVRESLSGLPFAKNVRGVGMLNAFDIDTDTQVFAAACLEQGVLIGAFRPGPGVVKITPPLNITVQQLKYGINLMKKAHATVK